MTSSWLTLPFLVKNLNVTIQHITYRHSTNNEIEFGENTYLKKTVLSLRFFFFKNDLSRHDVSHTRIKKFRDTHFA